MKWQEALRDYQHYLRIERGLSLNSIENYSYDIVKLIHYLEEAKIKISPLFSFNFGNAIRFYRCQYLIFPAIF